MSDGDQQLRDTPEPPKMRASVVAATVLFAISRGLSMEQITAATGLTRADLLDQDAWLSQDIVPTVWRLLAEVHPGKALALDMARAAPTSFFGPLNHVLSYAADLRAAITAIIRYQSVLADALRVTLVETPPLAALRIFHPTDAVDGGYGAEAGMGLSWRGIREVCGADTLVRVEFVHEPFGPVAAYEEFFGTAVQFGKTHNALVLRSEALDQPIPQSDPQMFRYIQAHLDLVRERLLARRGSGELIRIRQAIAHNAERSEYGAEALARHLGMSLRALQRLTRTHDLTVRELLDEAREANARQFLGDARLSIDEVSFLLGYSEGRAFRRAFRRWTGQSPAEFRRAAS